MNINELTLGQIKSLQNILGFNTQTSENLGLLRKYIGKYVICRTGNEGINSGYVEALDETGVILKDARRLYYHKPANKNVSWYEGVAKYGISGDSKIGTAIEKVLVEDYSLTVCTVEAEKSLTEAKDNAQS